VVLADVDLIYYPVHTIQTAAAIVPDGGFAEFSIGLL
jgi:hypothetical protein